MKRILVLLLLCVLARGALAERMLVTSDLHLTRDRDAHRDTVQALLKAAKDVDTVLFLGDSTNNARPEEHAFFLEVLERIREKSGAAIYILPGNHDLSASFRPEGFADFYAGYGYAQAFSRDMDSGSYAVLTAQGTCLLMMNTNGYTALDSVAGKGGISASAIDWARRVLQDLPGETRTVACGHHPILPIETRAETTGNSLLAQVLDEGKIPLYLCGHDHGFATVQGSFQQITVGQPHTYPGWAGVLEVKEDEMLWQVISLYDPEDPAYRAMREASLRLGRAMGEGALKDTAYEGDEEAISWFCTAFELMMQGELTEERCQGLLGAKGALKWREAEVKTVVKRWIFSVLENCPQDARRIVIDSEEQ